MWNAPTDYYKQIEFYTITWFGTDTPQYTAIIHSLEKNEQFKNREVSNADFVFDVEMFGKKIFAYSLNLSDWIWTVDVKEHKLLCFNIKKVDVLAANDVI